MRQYLLLWALFALTLPLFGQSPQKFKFQAVARDISGQPYASVDLGVRISLVRDAVSGQIDYAERHVVTTSPLGVFDLEIGGGQSISGAFTDASWANHPYYLKIDIDPDGGTNYVNLGTSQLLSVPYAIYAGEAGNAGDGDPTDELQTLIYDPDLQTLTLTNGNTVNLIFSASTAHRYSSISGSTTAHIAANGPGIGIIENSGAGEVVVTIPEGVEPNYINLFMPSSVTDGGAYHIVLDYEGNRGYNATKYDLNIPLVRTGLDNYDSASRPFPANISENGGNSANTVTYGVSAFGGGDGSDLTISLINFALGINQMCRLDF
ncbi:hypothetical protein [Phaeodactylibacter luteus]|uniref:Uncharacterized protein n=1 Tax=Phaeodactylibacter luteus TaxID=1564516 RepID=A0A5C6RFE8_9BACT|nr:hypothetical protein [Phaeodactylibacter luteus]TXB58619.1 hypothetical protein FRY97_21540 [Phaeodactylibacter luteus]